jgi:hypothetical protein
MPRPLSGANRRRESCRLSRLKATPRQATLLPGTQESTLAGFLGFLGRLMEASWGSSQNLFHIVR